MNGSDRAMRVARRWIMALAGVASTLVPGTAAAHFYLEGPASWAEQDTLGNPQKLGPCGNDGAVPTGEITAFQTGETITITIRETIFHPGHYRVALSVNDRSELPEPPPVTAGTTPCGSAPIDDSPTFPVLADGVLLHTAPFSGPQSFEVTLPPGVTCERCTLQVIEFMSNHGLNDPGGCYYSHCADLAIRDVAVETDAAASLDAGGAVSMDSGTEAPDARNPPRADAGAAPAVTSSGCGCAAPGPQSSAGWAGLALALPAALLARRRRARRS